MKKFSSDKKFSWIWLALDTTTKQVIACHIEGREIKDDKTLWSLIPEVYKNDANFYTDQLGAYQQAISAELHYPSQKKWSHTSLIERLNCNLR